MNYGCSIMPNIQSCLSIVKQTVRWRSEHCLHVSQENKQNKTKQNFSFTIWVRQRMCLQARGKVPKSVWYLVLPTLI